MNTGYVLHMAWNGAGNPYCRLSDVSETEEDIIDRMDSLDASWQTDPIKTPYHIWYTAE